MRWPYFYISFATGEHPLARTFLPPITKLLKLFQPHIDADPPDLSPPQSTPKDRNRITFADTYHGKVVPLAEAKQLVSIEREINLTNLEQIIPYAMACDIVLHNPTHIVALECPCRHGRANPCQPLDVCLVIGEPFASFVAEHHPSRSRWITSAEAIEILQAEHERGHVHHAFFKDAMMGRFYAICNCCACCCGAMQAWYNGIPMLASSGYVSQVDEMLCAGCGTCAEVCQFKALSASNGVAIVDTERCMGCGVCQSECEQGAISLVRDPAKGEPLAIHKLITSAR
jgi:ferredoxin